MAEAGDFADEDDTGSRFRRDYVNDREPYAP
jgi:hypothetical protein